MAVFQQMKDSLKLMQEARAMQKKLKAMRITGMSEDERVSVEMNGAQEIESINIDDELINLDRKRDLVRSLKDALTDGQKKLQKEMMKDMDMNKLKSMLG